MNWKNTTGIWKGISASGLLLILTGSLTLTSCDDKDEQPATTNYTISGNATGDQVVPAVSGTGTGTISGTYNPDTRMLTYSSNWNSLSGAPSTGGFYNGGSGIAGTAVGAPWTFDANATGTGTTNGSMTLTEAQASQFLGGNWYYSYSTAANPGGEVRGQITTTQAAR